MIITTLKQCIQATNNGFKHAPSESDRQTSDDGRSRWRFDMVYEDVCVDVCKCVYM